VVGGMIGGHVAITSKKTCLESMFFAMFYCLGEFRRGRPMSFMLRNGENAFF
jgi:hypothetical protein